MHESIDSNHVFSVLFHVLKLRYNIKNTSKLSANNCSIFTHVKFELTPKNTRLWRRKILNKELQWQTHQISNGIKTGGLKSPSIFFFHLGIFSITKVQSQVRPEQYSLFDVAHLAWVNRYLLTRNFTVQRAPVIFLYEKSWVQS